MLFAFLTGSLALVVMCWSRSTKLLYAGPDYYLDAWLLNRLSMQLTSQVNSAFYPPWDGKWVSAFKLSSNKVNVFDIHSIKQSWKDMDKKLSYRLKTGRQQCISL